MNKITEEDYVDEKIAKFNDNFRLMHGPFVHAHRKDIENVIKDAKLEYRSYEISRLKSEIKEEYIEEHNKNIKEWNRENVLEQLKKDVKFGWKKACDERGISSSLMYYVVLSWNRVLEEGLEDWDEDNYAMYGKPLFKATAEKYGWNLDDE